MSQLGGAANYASNNIKLDGGLENLSSHDETIITFKVLYESVGYDQGNSAALQMHQYQASSANQSAQVIGNDTAENTPLLHSSHDAKNIPLDRWISNFTNRLIPGDRSISIRRRIFLFLTEPQSSILSFVFFIILILAISLSNILMMFQTMPLFQFTPPDCVICGGTNEYYSNNDDTTYYGPSIPDLVDLPIDCECPPVPLPWTVYFEDITIWLFTAEWILRVSCGSLSYISQPMTILDALAIFPYYAERYESSNGLLSLRLLRLFRVFQLLRLGKYNDTFVSLMNVLSESILSFNILLIVLLFGSAFFGSMIYWLEKGEWKYSTYNDTPTFAYMRLAADGISEEPSPFTSIPASFWWFIVTASTVGYGDTYPTSIGGKCIAALAMMMGVLVIAFPVSVFSDLWSKELKKQGVLDQPESSGERERLLKQQSASGDAKMSHSDLKAIRQHLARIDESQDEIRRIISIYDE